MTQPHNNTFCARESYRVNVEVVDVSVPVLGACVV